MFKKFDIFSSTFLFNIGYKQDSKKTTFGALLAILIFGISLGYLGYLASTYFSNQILPKISSSDSVPTSIQYITDKNQFVFTMMISNTPHRALAKTTGKNYITYKVQYLEGQETSMTPKMTLLNVIQCEEEQYKDYDCVDITDTTNKISKDSKGQLIIANNIVIWAYPCSGAANNCHAAQDIKDALAHPANHFYFLSRVDQYDVHEKGYKSIYVSNIYQISQSLSIFSYVNAQNQRFEITSGPFIQTTEVVYKIKEYKRVDAYFTNTDTIGSGGSIVGIVLSNDENQVTTKIQFPQITEIIAQFSGILNVLLALGFLGRMASKSQLFVDIKDIVIKNTFLNQYKKELSQNQEVIDIVNMARVFPLNNIQNQQQQLSAIQSFQKSQNAEEEMLRNLPPSDRKLLVEYFNDKTESTLNIQKLLGDFLFMQRAMKMLLTKEQYVALKYCGQEIDLFQNQKAQQNQKQDSEGQLQNFDAQTPETEKIQEIDNFKNTPLHSTKKGLLPDKNIELSGSSLILPNTNNNNKPAAKSHFSSNKQVNNYLSELAQVDQNLEEQERILKDYLKKLQSNNDTQLTHVDNKIYSSLPKQ